jgi:hypothetical protein
VRYGVLDPALSAEGAGPAVVRSWRSCYPALHSSVAEQMARHLAERDYEASRSLRRLAARADWRALEATLAPPVVGLAA